MSISFVFLGLTMLPRTAASWFAPVESSHWSSNMAVVIARMPEVMW